MPRPKKDVESSSKFKLHSARVGEIVAEAWKSSFPKEIIDNEHLEKFSAGKNIIESHGLKDGLPDIKVQKPREATKQVEEIELPTDNINIDDIPITVYLKRLEVRGFDLDFIKSIIPYNILRRDEIKLYFKLVDAYFSDFSADELSFSDIDAILELVFDRVMQMRLIERSKGDNSTSAENTKMMLELGKQISHIKKDLSSTRSDRLKLKGNDGFNILNLVIMADEAKQLKKLKKADELDQENKKYLEKLDKRGFQE